jgi:F-type H+-transporting ATPase subunit b
MPQKCSTYRPFSFFFLLALTVGVAVAPFRLAAQTAEPANNPAPVAQSANQPAAETAKPEKKSEEEQTNAFRLEGPVVKWTAKTFNLSPSVTATIFEFINFAVIFFGLGIPLLRWLPKLLRTRGEKVRNDIDSARKVTEDANARLSAIETKLSGLDKEIALIQAQVEAESRQDQVRIKSTIEEESTRIVAAAEQEIDASAAQARRSLRHFAADLAIDQAAQQLVLTPEADQALIVEFLGDVASKSAHQGGQN